MVPGTTDLDFMPDDENDEPLVLNQDPVGSLPNSNSKGSNANNVLESFHESGEESLKRVSFVQSSASSGVKRTTEPLSYVKTKSKSKMER